MKKKLWALFLAVLLVFQLVSPAEAAEQVYFTAAGESVLPLSDSTMPFWNGGYLYVPSTMFTDNVWRALGVSYIRTSRKKVILHSAGSSLVFEMGENYAKDSDGGRHSPGAVERNGIAFVPAYLVASYFGLQYSVTDVPRGYLVWLRKPNFGLSDKAFADAANYNMETEYAAYDKARNQVVTPQEEKPQPQPEEPPSSPGAGIYLCMEAGTETAVMLDVLQAARSSAAFFCRPEFLKAQGDLLRRMVADGHTVGILLEGGTPETMAEQLQEANEALERATCSKTRLVYLEGETEEELQALEALGYVGFQPDLDRTEYKLKSASNASSLMNRISSWKESVSVWVGDTANAFGLRHFLAAVDRAEDQCLALTEPAAFR